MHFQFISTFLLFVTTSIAAATNIPVSAHPDGSTDVSKKYRGPTLFQQIAQIYLPAMNQPTADSQTIALSEPVTLALNEADQRDVAFAIISTQPLGNSAAAEDADTADIVTWQNLELFDGANLCSTLNRASTKLGEAYFAGLIAKPTNNVAEIRRRQQIVRSLLEARELRIIIAKICAQIRQLEPALLHLWKQENPHIEEAIRWLYIPTLVTDYYPTLQYQPSSLEFWRRQEDLGSVFFMPGAVISLSYLLDRPTLSQELKAPFLNKPSTLSPLKTWRNFVYSWVSVISGIYSIPTAAHYTYQHFTFIHRNLKYLHSRYQPLAEAVQLMYDLHVTLLAHFDVIKNIEECKPLIDLFNQQDNQLLMQLLDELKQLTGPFSYWSSTGRILTIHSLAKKCMNEISPALASVGALDAYVGITRLMRESPNERGRFSFPQLIAAEKPALQLIDFWNPFVARNLVVPNSLTLGGGNAATGIVLTGQNTGGKSTVLKGVALSLWLGQTIGISPARQALFTPFDSMSTYMNITDKNGVKEGKSLFAAEVSRAKEVLDNVKALDPDQKAFLIIDEAFKGTGGEAEGLSYWYGQQLAALPNLICLNATHYPKLTKLEAETNGLYQNYKVEVLIDPNDTLVRPYKLEKGATYYNIAEYILIEQGLKPSH